MQVKGNRLDEKEIKDVDVDVEDFSFDLLDKSAVNNYPDFNQ